jgi:hypothetical protein
VSTEEIGTRAAIHGRRADKVGGRGLAGALAGILLAAFVVVREISSLEKFGLVEAASAQLNAGLLM